MNRLRVLRQTRQIEGEPHRAWYFSSRLDLVVWFDEARRPIGFQLAYDKARGEHTISWHWQRGLQHYAVDDGEAGPLASQSPCLLVNGPFEAPRIHAAFLAASSELPAEVRDFVLEKLEQR